MLLIYLIYFPVQDVGYQHGKLLFTGWARGDIIENMLKDHRSADYTDSKKTDVSVCRPGKYRIFFIGVAYSGGTEAIIPDKVKFQT